MRKKFQKTFAFFKRRSIFAPIESECSAAWFSAFDWGSKGREFKSHHSDHFLFIRISSLPAGVFLFLGESVQGPGNHSMKRIPFDFFPEQERMLNLL